MEERIIKDINNLLAQLFQKMKEAGYIWDSENKKLKGEEVDNIHNYLYGEQSPAWREEDESLCRQIKGILSVCRTKSILSFDLYKKMLNWLKSLKERYTWKPSDEQMKMLDEVLNFAANHESPYWNDYIFGILNNLIRQLKKLKS